MFVIQFNRFGPNQPVVWGRHVVLFMHQAITHRSFWTYLFTTRWVLHAFFWLAWYGAGVFYTLIGVISASPTYYGALLVAHISIAAVSYVHLYGLLPRFFERKQYVSYGLALAGLSIGGTLLLTFLRLMLSANARGFWQTAGAQSTTIVLFFIITTFLHRYRQLQRNNRSLREQQVETELHLLKQQINPHFFFNNLNSLYSLALAQSPHTPAQILRLADLMRYMFDFASQPQVALHKELEYLQNYVALEKVRLVDPAAVRLTVQGNPMGWVIAPMMLLPFVENAFKHGIEQQSRHGVVSIEVAVQANGLFLLVENSRPRPAARQAETTGTGIANVRKRLGLLYPNRHTLSIEESAQQFRVALSLAL